MIKINQNYINSIFKILTFIILGFYTYNSFIQAKYEILFIDERLLIDDIYNFWLVDDIFNRFTNLEDSFLKSILIISTELAYGGDLRYGRLWSNFFTLAIGYFSLVNDSFLIIASRLLNTLIYFYANFLIVKYLVDKKYFWICLFSIYSLPGVELLHRITKPETMSLLFLAFAFLFTVKEKSYKAIFCLATATFIKINFIFIFICFLFYFLNLESLNRLRFIVKSSLITLFALIVVNPILIIPPVKIGSIEFPNFYKIYFGWLSSESQSGNNIQFNLNTFSQWKETISNFYLRSNNFDFILVLITISFIFLIFNILKNKNPIFYVLLCSAVSYFLFYLFLIERQFIWYLTLPFTLYLLMWFEVIAKTKHFLVRGSILSFIIILSLFGSVSNFSNSIEQKKFAANSRYGYVGIESVNDAVSQISRVHSTIETIYIQNDHLTTNIIYWHPDLFIPRNKVTYDSFYYVREYWGSKDSPLSALDNADMFVTYTNYGEGVDYEVYQIENLYIYFKKYKY